MFKSFDPKGQNRHKSSKKKKNRDTNHIFMKKIIKYFFYFVINITKHALLLGDYFSTFALTWRLYRKAAQGSHKLSTYLV